MLVRAIVCLLRLLVWFAALSTPCFRVARAEEAPVGILVLKEHGVSGAAYAQPYVDKFMGITAQLNKWPSAKGEYLTTRASAEAFIQENSPHYGILSLAAFLALREKYHLRVIGQVEVPLAGGQQYYVISKSVPDLAGCKGKTLATDHADDPRFIERVVAGGQFTLHDFTLVQTQRPLQTIKKVIGDEAPCGLVDDAQLAELPHIEGVDGVHAIWKSPALPPMVVVAFANAPANERDAFQASLEKLCDDDGESICAEVGMKALRAASDKDYAAVVAAYGR